MTTNEALFKEQLIKQIELVPSMSKDLKVKLMKMRFAASGVRKKYDADIQELTEGLRNERLTELHENKERNTDEEKEYNDILEVVNKVYSDKMTELLQVQVNDLEKFTEEEYFEIVETYSVTEVFINENKVKPTDFLEILHELFV